MSFSKIFQISTLATITNCESYERQVPVKHIFLNNSGGLYSFVKFSKIFQFLPMLQSQTVNQINAKCL